MWGLITGVPSKAREFLFVTVSRLALGIQLVPRSLSERVKRPGIELYALIHPSQSRGA
jgi:hypothetical protein